MFTICICNTTTCCSIWKKKWMKKNSEDSQNWTRQQVESNFAVRGILNLIVSKLDKHVVLLPITYYSTQKQMKRANFWWKVSRFFQIDSLNKKYPIYFKFNQKGSVDNIGLTDSYIISIFRQLCRFIRCDKLDGPSMTSDSKPFFPSEKKN